MTAAARTDGSPFIACNLGCLRLDQCTLECKRTPVEHELKTWPEFFTPIIEGRKPFEYRLNDRDFRRGDVLWLREYVPPAMDYDEIVGVGRYTGRETRLRVGYVLNVSDLGPAARSRAQPGPGFVIMALREIHERDQESEGAYLDRTAFHPSQLGGFKP